MHRVADYIKRAEDAEAMAAQMGPGEVHDQMVDIAAQWRRLATQAAHLAADEAVKTTIIRP